MASARSRLSAPAGLSKPLAPPRGSRLAGCIAIVLCALIVASLSDDQVFADTLMNLYAGREIWTHGLPHTDPFTIAGRGRPWIDGQWLANLSFYGAYSVGGLWLVGKLALAGLVTGYGALWLLLRRIGASLRVQAIAPPAALVLNALGLFARAQDLVIVLFVGLLWILRDEDVAEPRSAGRSAASVAAILAILALWANLHGTSLMAAGIAAAYACFRVVALVRRRPLPVARLAAPWAALLLLAPLTPFATPYGFDVVGQFRAIAGNSAFQRGVLEWQPLWKSGGLAFGAPSLLLAALVVATAVRGRGGVRAPLAALLALLVVATVIEARFAVWLAIVSAVALGELSAARRARAEPGSLHRSLPARVLPALVTLCLATALAGVFVEQGDGDGYTLERMPVATVAAGYRVAQANPHAVVLGDLESSALMLWLHPDMRRRVEFDPRLEIYRQRDLDRWLDFRNARGSAWFALARSADIVLASRSWSPRLTRRLLAPRPGWRATQTPDGALLVRDR